MKLFKYFFILIFFSVNIMAIDISLDGTIEKIAGNSDINYCETGDKFRVGTTATYHGEEIDLIVEVIAEDNEYDEYVSDSLGTPCIGVSNGLLETRLRDHDNDGSKLAYMDLKIIPVLKDTETILEIDRFVFSGFDLDSSGQTTGEYATKTDDVYFITPTIGYISQDSQVTYSEGDFGNGFDKKLQGRESGNCDDSKDSPEPECRGGGILAEGSNGFNQVDSIYIRVANDNAYSDTDSKSAHRLIQLSFEEGDFNVMLNGAVDHGDAPNSYEDSNNTIDVGMILGIGLVADNENAQYSTNADADDKVEVNTTNFDDEDSIYVIHGSEKNNEFYINQNNKVEVTTIGEGYINIWIDFNEDGDFDDEEHVITDTYVNSTTAEVTTSTISVPLDVNFNSNTILRIRFSDRENISSSGYGSKGETEDHLVKLVTTAPVAKDDNASGESGESVTLKTLLNDSDPEDDINRSSVNITTDGAVDSDGDGDNDTLVVPGEGTWKVDNTTGDITFTPEEGFTGDPTPITYNVKDNTGLVSNEATEYVDYPQSAPVAKDDNASGESGESVTLKTLLNDSDPEDDINRSSVNITTDGAVDSDGDGDNDTLVVPGEGTWKVDNTTGDITFTPEEGFTGDPTPITYNVKDNTGLVSNEATEYVDYPQSAPVAKDDIKQATPGEIVVIDVLKNDETNASTIYLISPEGEKVKELVVAGEGTWKVDEKKGEVIFMPEENFSTNPTPIKYVVEDSLGGETNSATITILYSSLDCIGGKVWYDKNLNGIQDEGEDYYVTGLSIDLYNTEGTLIESTKTDDTGSYKFCNIDRESQYKIKVTIPETYYPTLQYAGEITQDSDIDENGWIYVSNVKTNSFSYDAGIYCSCDDYKVHPENYKELNFSALNRFNMGILFLVIWLFGTFYRKGTFS